MGLGLAIKAFFKAFREPKQAEEFLNEAPKQIESFDSSHLRLLGMLQQSGRLIDFLKEDISAFTDAQVGAAVRKIHEDCAKSLEEFVTVRPLMDEKEGSTIRIPEGYDVESIHLVGNVKGNPPYQGTLVHKGWKAHKRSLPKKVSGQASAIICPAEVEIR
jgi:hypothetical protein